MTTDDVARLVSREWGLEVSAYDLPGDVDRNFRVETPDRRSFVLKIARSLPGDVPLAVCQEAMALVAAISTGFRLPAVLPSL